MPLAPLHSALPVPGVIREMRGQEIYERGRMGTDRGWVGDRAWGKEQSGNSGGAGNGRGGKRRARPRRKGQRGDRAGAWEKGWNGGRAGAGRGGVGVGFGAESVVVPSPAPA